MHSTMNINSLSQLKKGQKGRILNIESSDPVSRQRLLDMGLTDGVIVTILKVAPLGDPVCLELRGYSLLVRKSEVALVQVEVIK